ncbi:hypothetical protein BDP27DRAFT_1373015 [Rhodocollybia butyracea]|uniref:Uncharacterized protein n=1 Tax=Rhodocollybia butyracea TaxID=206335 RepID=A0A9P5TXI3_9AGAR|nr:hypothetical protein BDP27DRAFT_1373015 [Rhodocollybia butyracea]
MTLCEDSWPPKPGRIIAQIPSTFNVPYSAGRWSDLFDKALDLHSSGWASRISYASLKPSHNDEILDPFCIEMETQLSATDIQTAWLVQAECILDNIEQQHEIGSIPYFSFNVQPYFWSLDENGAQPMSPTTQTLLGLPLFKASVSGGKQWSTEEHMAVSQYLRLKGFSEVNYSRKRGYPLLEAPKNVVSNDEFEIVDAVSDDTGDDWELIPQDKACQSSVSKAQWLPRSAHCVNSHFHNSDCIQVQKTPRERLRQNRSLSSLNPKGTIEEPISPQSFTRHLENPVYVGNITLDGA